MPPRLEQFQCSGKNRRSWPCPGVCILQNR
jgi:hypothetical protein